MLNAGRILKSISKSSYQSTPESPAELNAVAAFLSWLAYSTDPDDLVTPELVGQFFQEAMDYPHWQQQRKTLSEEVRRFLDAICQHQDELFKFNEVQWADNMQIVELEQHSDWVDCVGSYLTNQYHAQEKFRLLHDSSQQKMIAVVLANNGELLVRQFSKKFFVRDGALAPLREDLSLKYDRHFELKSEVPHKIETAPFTTARFRVMDRQASGVISRGYFFQKLNEFSNAELASFPKLFYTIRRLEQHFIKRESDPFYQYVVDSTEHAVRMLRIGDSEAVQKAPDILSSAQNALEFVFIGDKLLSLLVRDLQHTMASERREPTREAVPTTAVRQKKEDELWSPHLTLDLLESPKSPATNSQKLRVRTRESDLTN